MNYPKRLIEVDLPIKRISAHASREKSIRHGHISTLHIWWARRPLAACRAVICAALWPDPADPLCPQIFRDKAAELITSFATKAATSKLMETCSQESMKRWINACRTSPMSFLTTETELVTLRDALLDFIADFANWDNSTVKEYLETSRALTQAAHEALGGEPGTRPLVVDPFAGGGSIPLEALRIGADAFASDLNPVAVLLNKVVLEYIPNHGHQLADEVTRWSEWIRDEAEKVLGEFYPKDPDGSTPIAYLWARTIKCEGPGCEAEVPLMRSLWLARKGNHAVALQFVPEKKGRRIEFEIIERRGNTWNKQDDPNAEVRHPQFNGTVKRGSATCPICGYTTPVSNVRAQLKKRKGGSADARLFCVVTKRQHQQGRCFRLTCDRDFDALSKASAHLKKVVESHSGDLSLTPDEPLDPAEPRRIPLGLYGMTNWSDLFIDRQLVALVTFGEALRACSSLHKKNELGAEAEVILALSVSKLSDRNSTLCRWISQNQSPGYTFARQALPMLWDFAESVPLKSGGGWEGIISDTVEMIRVQAELHHAGQAAQSSAEQQLLPDESANLFFTDPPLLFFYSLREFV